MQRCPYIIKKQVLKDSQELTRLFKRYLADECSEDEKRLLFESLSAEEFRSLYLQLIEENLELNADETLQNQPHVREILQEARKKIAETIGEPPSTPAQIPGRFWHWSIPAAAVILCACAITFYFFRAEKVSERIPEVYTAAPDIGPGGNKAILTLADGSKISLTDAGKGTLAREQGVSVTKSADGQITYNIEQAGNAADNAQDAFNTIATPRGGQYNVVLPDGTRIWLNAASSITYPVKFGKEQRRVVLHGEAYFEVARQQGEGRSGRIPFIVATADQEVEVLGTHFNINGYTDEPMVKTTLLEGKVRVSQKSGGNAILAPGQQSRTSRDRNNVQVVNADLKAEMAWKSNQFFFEDEPIESIMRQIARWYDVEVIYKDDLKNKTVWGSMTRFSNISKVLNIIEQTGNVHFKIEGRQVMVMK